MLHLLLLLLVGIVSAQECGDCPQDDLQTSILPDVNLNKCNMPETLDNTPVGDCQKETCHKVDLKLKCGSKHRNMCPGKKTCAIKLMTYPMIFALAQDFCRGEGGRLISIHDSCVNNHVRAQGQKFIGNLYSWVWIGVFQPINSSQYENVDGSRLDYTNWAVGQPNKPGPWCTALNVASGQWQSAPCNIRLPFVCTI